MYNADYIIQVLFVLILWVSLISLVPGDRGTPEDWLRYSTPMVPS